MITPDRIIGQRLFTDGTERRVFEDDQGRQYVLDDDGQRVDGVWLPPADEPIVVSGPGKTLADSPGPVLTGPTEPLSKL
jgi:hypothetical protein